MKKPTYLLMVLKVPRSLEQLRWKPRQYGNTTVFAVRNRRDLTHRLEDPFAVISLNHRYEHVKARVYTLNGELHFTKELTKRQVLHPNFWVNQGQQHSINKAMRLLGVK